MLVLARLVTASARRSSYLGSKDEQLPDFLLDGVLLHEQHPPGQVAHLRLRAARLLLHLLQLDGLGKG